MQSTPPWTATDIAKRFPITRPTDVAQWTLQPAVHRDFTPIEQGEHANRFVGPVRKMDAIGIERRPSGFSNNAALMQTVPIHHPQLCTAIE